ncbi:hypothetical protein D623_10017047 [Myotis brandtii]|uniref:Uncharacterized protein n=1 Tax=Myotis brandtii TaxID=109478 RepID=S7MWG9_MYOBR|nr:hypothetical protein D623_10017047 [Myotis brandtii]
MPGTALSSARPVPRHPLQPFPTAMVRFTATPSADEWGHLRAQAALPSSLAGQEEPPGTSPSRVKCPLWGYERQGYISSLFCPTPSRD